jgi:hypothetical protein
MRDVMARNIYFTVFTVLFALVVPPDLRADAKEPPKQSGDAVSKIKGLQKERIDALRRPVEVQTRFYEQGRVD